MIDNLKCIWEYNFKLRFIWEKQEEENKNLKVFVKDIQKNIKSFGFSFHDKSQLCVKDLKRRHQQRSGLFTNSLFLDTWILPRHVDYRVKEYISTSHGISQ